MFKEIVDEQVKECGRAEYSNMILATIEVNGLKTITLMLAHCYDDEEVRHSLIMKFVNAMELLKKTPSIAKNESSELRELQTALLTKPGVLWYVGEED